MSLPDSVPDEVRWRRAKSGFALTPTSLFEGRRVYNAAALTEK